MGVKEYCSGLQHIGIPTNNINETVEIYKKLGFEVAYTTRNGDETVTFLRMYDLVIETYENNQAVMKSGAIDHFAINVKNIDSLFEEIKGMGFEMLDKQVNSLPFWENGVKFFTILGPNKEKVEFCEYL